MFNVDLSLSEMIEQRKLNKTKPEKREINPFRAFILVQLKRRDWHSSFVQLVKANFFPYQKLKSYKVDEKTRLNGT
jgi:hypothetical protein